ncbi:RNA polymerase sigma factor [Micromonospora sp. CA-263727]|uniref:RNA polymerase sigma factor n=1 Tax=Micromonospora sp. CA-263727 TaxID=3239967 RepID=UPI003D8A0113
MAAPTTADEAFRRIADDPHVFEEFYRRHVEAVQRFIARRVEDPHLAADLTADVFLAVIESVHTYHPGRGTPIGWLYGVARNVVSADRRRQAKEYRAASRVVGRALVDVDDLSRIEERIDAEACSRELYRSMDRLPESERMVLELVALDGLPVTEAARVLGIKPSTARVRLHRARRPIRRHLAAVPAPLQPATEVPG